MKQVVVELTDAQAAALARPGSANREVTADEVVNDLVLTRANILVTEYRLALARELDQKDPAMMATLEAAATANPAAPPILP